MTGEQSFRVYVHWPESGFADEEGWVSMAERSALHRTELFLKFLRSMGRAIKVEEGGRVIALFSFASCVNERGEIRMDYSPAS